MLCFDFFDFLRSTISFPRSLSELSGKRGRPNSRQSSAILAPLHNCTKKSKTKNLVFAKFYEKNPKKKYSGGWGQWSVQAKQKKSQAIRNPSSNLNTDRQMMRVCELIIDFSAGYYGVVWISSMRKHMFLARAKHF
jgi:hypothetical protein